MNRSRRTQKRRGVALLLVLWLVALLAMVTIAASSSARGSTSLVSARRAAAVARSMAESGITVASKAIDDSLSGFAGDSTRRDNYLNALDAGTNGGRSALGTLQTDTLADGAWAIAAVDVSARLDVNNTSAEGLARLFASAMSIAAARAVGERIAASVRGEGLPDDSVSRAADARDSLARALLGAGARTTHLRRPIESLDELAGIANIDERTLAELAPLLTVDGDGNVNMRAAPQSVRAAASGSHVDAPTRLLLVARGWQLGHPLTHEIQAVYDVSGTSLKLVAWRERTR